MDEIENRQIRIFISSTFRDMQAERNYLITKVFPRVQAEAAKRDVTIVPVDLRWGVTEEESRSGKVIQICLQEIENSHPFFIGLIGERYGWCPTLGELQKNEILQERWGKWLEKDIEQGLSVTEIEMQYGVLRSKEKLNAYFYLKKNCAPNDADRAKLEKLKTVIRENGRYPYSEYSSPEELGEQVEMAFMLFLNTHYPTTGISELQKERLVQDAFLHSRTDVYIPNSDDFKILDDFLTDTTQHNFVVTGESGLGKSALIANWVSNHRNKDKWNIIYHFVGNGGQEGDYYRILSRLCNEIRELYNLAEATDLEKNQGLTEQLNTLYTKIYEKKPLLIILDGINQLADIDNAKTLEWLPIPNRNVKNLFSTLKDDKTMTVFRQSNYPCFELLPLNPERKHRLISEYLHQYGKSLLSEQINRISHHALYNNTLFLRTLLNELISFGQHEALNAYINEYMQIQDAYGFFKKVINRYLDEYSILAKITLSLIAASQKGLTENEILSLTGAKQLYWSQFYCAFKGHFTISNGLITFSHQYISNTISFFFKKEIEDERDSIIEYFKKESSFRSTEELAFQYYQQKKCKELYCLLLNFDTFNYLYIQNIDKLAAYWKILVDAGYSIEDYLRLSSNETYEYSVSLERIATFIEHYFLNKGLSYDEVKSLRKQKKDIQNNFYDEYNFVRIFKEKSIEIVKSEKGENSKEYADMCMSLAYTYWNTSGLRYAHGLGGSGTWIWYACKAMEIYHSIYSDYPTDYLINASKITLINTFGQSAFTLPNSQLGGIVNECLEVIEHLLKDDPSQFYNQYIYMLLGSFQEYVPMKKTETSFSSRMFYEKALELCTQTSRSETIEKAFLFYCLSQDNNRQIEERTELLKKSMTICNNLYGEHHAFSQDLKIKYEEFQRDCEEVQDKKEKKCWKANLLNRIDKRIRETDFGQKMMKRMKDSFEKNKTDLFGENNIDSDTATKIHGHMLIISELLDSHWNNNG